VAIIWPRGNSGSQESGGHSLPVYGEGLAGELLNITHTSLVAVSQDAGKKGAIMLTPACCLGHPFGWPRAEMLRAQHDMLNACPYS